MVKAEKTTVLDAKVIVSLSSVLKIAKDYNEIKRLRDESWKSKINYEVYNARFLAYNNIISDLNLPVEL